MGVTIHYRGSLADLDRVEDFEDRVIDLVLALGGNVRMWRAADDVDRSRIIRGLMIDMAPGQETTSLLISPEGWFIHLMEIEDAEKGLLTEPSWCWVKTQFGPVEGHVALVELFSAIQREFAPNLEVSDEGEYWETRSLPTLRRKCAFVGAMIDGLANAIKNDRLSPEAAEDPQILATRIERLANIVHQTISRPSEHAPVDFSDDEPSVPIDPRRDEQRWDSRDVKTSSDSDDGEDVELNGAALSLQSKAQALMVWIDKLSKSGADKPPSSIEQALRGAGDVIGGLAQALPLPVTCDANDIRIGFSLVQLKRALRGAAFTQGALFLLRYDKVIDEQTFQQQSDELKSISKEIVELIRTLRSDQR